MPKELIFNGVQGLVGPAGPVGGQAPTSNLPQSHAGRGIRVDTAHTLTWDPTMIVIDALRKVGPDASTNLTTTFSCVAGSIQGISSPGDQAGIGESGAALFRWNASRRNGNLPELAPVAVGARTKVAP